MLARPRLVVASASKPSDASSLAVPASQGFGMTKAPGRPCRARKTSAFCACVLMSAPPPSAPRRRVALDDHARLEQARDLRLAHARPAQDVDGVFAEAG